MIETKDMLRIARAVAARYKKRCWWADVDDMTSVACIAILESQDGWDPQVGIPIDGYVARAAALRIKDYLWRQSSPVSGGMHKPREVIAGVHSVPLEEDMVRHEENVGQQLDRAKLRLRVRKQVRVLAANTRDGDAAVEVLLHNRESGEVKAETGKDVYGAVHLVRRKMREDSVLYKIWRRLC